MSTAVAKVAVAIVANTQGFSNGMQRAQKDVRSFATSVRKEQGSFDNLKSTFGESSKFGQFASLLRGAGIATGAIMLAKYLGNAAQEMGKVAVEIRKGEAGMGDLAEAAIGVIPVFGQIWQAGRQIHQGVLDTASAMAEWLGFSKGVVDWLESYETKLARLTEEEKLVAEVQEAVRKSQAKLRQSTLSGIEKEKAAIEDRYAEELAKIEELRKAMDTIREDGNRKAGLFALQQLQEALKAIRDADLANVRRSSITTTGPKTISAMQAGSSGGTDMSKFVTAQREVNTKIAETNQKILRSFDMAEQRSERRWSELFQLMRYGLGQAST